MANTDITKIPAPRTPFLDQETGDITPAWYRFLYNIFTITGNGTGTGITVPNGGTGANSLTGYVKGNGTNPFTAVLEIPTTDLSGTITNAQLAHSTISGVPLGDNLYNLTAGVGVSFSTGTTYNGSADVTINTTPNISSLAFAAAHG